MSGDPDDLPAGFASPPCFLHELDPAFDATAEEPPHAAKKKKKKGRKPADRSGPASGAERSDVDEAGKKSSADG